MKRPRPATVARTAGAAASGALLAISRPPFDIGPLACVALVPLFIVWRGRTPFGAARLAFVAGFVYYLTLCAWIWYFGTVAVVPFAAVVALYWAAAGAMVAWFRLHRIASPWLTAAVWVVVEAILARWPFGGFSWGEVGYAFHNIAPARAVASVGGVTFVSFLAVVLNALVADLIMERGTVGSYLRAQAGVAVVALVVVASTVTRAEPHGVGSLRVALVQGNDQDRQLTQAEMQADYLPNSHFALAQQISGPVDLIVFPESSMNTFDLTDPRTDPYISANLTAIAREHDSWVLANATVQPPNSNDLSNLDVLFDPTGAVAGTYAKRHLVPFGERVPFRAALSHVVGSELAQVPEDFKPGATPGLFTVAGVRIATLICFESAFGYQVRPLVKDGAQVLVVSTNNRSYRRSANSAQHIAIGQMRAAETGRPLVQASISGMSAVIDADGIVHDRTHLFDNTVVQTTVEATTGETPYVRYGEWVTFLCILAVAAALTVGTVRRRRDRSLDSPAELRAQSIEPSIDPTMIEPTTTPTNAGPVVALLADERESTAPP